MFAAHVQPGILMSCCWAMEKLQHILYCLFIYNRGYNLILLGYWQSVSIVGLSFTRIINIILLGYCQPAA